MKRFIEDYLQNPSEAVAKAAETLKGRFQDTFDDDIIYQQISSPEFRLYEQIIFAPSSEDCQRQVAAV